jgi:hypothetical protein
MEEGAITNVIARGAMPPVRGTLAYVKWRQGVLVELGMRSPTAVPLEPGDRRMYQKAGADLVHELATMLREAPGRESVILGRTIDIHADKIGHYLVEILARGGSL